MSGKLLKNPSKTNKKGGGIPPSNRLTLSLQKNLWTLQRYEKLLTWKNHGEI